MPQTSLHYSGSLDLRYILTHVGENHYFLVLGLVLFPYRLCHKDRSCAFPLLASSCLPRRSYAHNGLHGFLWKACLLCSPCKANALRSRTLLLRLDNHRRHHICPHHALWKSVSPCAKGCKEAFGLLFFSPFWIHYGRYCHCHGYRPIGCDLLFDNLCPYGLW